MSEIGKSITQGLNEAVIIAPYVAKIAELERRLEIDHAYDLDGNKVPFPKGMEMWDGVACRDETIRLHKERIAELERQLDSATEFVIDGPPTEPLSIYIRKCFGYRLPKEPMWKVMRGGQGGPVLAKDGEWELEPIPSSRDDEFYARCRFDTYDEALAAIEARKRSIDAARKEME